MPHTESMARLCPLPSLSKIHPFLTPVKPHPLTQTGLLASPLFMPISSLCTHTDLSTNVHYEQASPQLKTTQWLPTPLRVTTRKAFQGPALPNGALPAFQLHLKPLSFSVLHLQGLFTLSDVPWSFLLQALTILVLSLEHLP